MSQQLYARVFTQILDSSLADDWQARLVFEDLLKLATDGVVDMTREAIARRTNVPIDVIGHGLNVLESPDPRSRDPENQGRRLLRLDGHRDWGWEIVNWSKYESIRSTADNREKTKVRMQQRRASQSPLASPLTASASASEAEETKQNQTQSNISNTIKQNQTGKAAGAAPASNVPDAAFEESLRVNAAYQGIDVARVLAKCRAWCEHNGKGYTKRRAVNWLNREDVPLQSHTTPRSNPTSTRDMMREVI